MANNREVQVRPDTVEGEPVLRVELTQGKEAIVDRHIWNRIAKRHGARWQAVSNGRTGYYAKKRGRGRDGKRVSLSLAQVAAGVPRWQGRVVPINGNALDVRRSNLSINGRYIKDRSERVEGLPQPDERPKRPTRTTKRPRVNQTIKVIDEDEYSETYIVYHDGHPVTKPRRKPKPFPCKEYVRRVTNREPINGLDPWVCARTCTTCDTFHNRKKGDTPDV